MDLANSKVDNPSWFSKVLSGTGNFLQQNPELVSLTADQIGSKLNPNTPFSGIGSMLAKSSLATKAETERASKSEQIMNLIRTLTHGDRPGGNKVSFSMNPDGTLKTDFSSNLSLDEATKTPIGAGEAAKPESILEELQRKALGG